MITNYIELVVLVILALISDIRTCKIKNYIVFPFILIGLATNLMTKGINGLANSLEGLGLPILILLPLFALRMLGAGDVKLFSAIGSIMGPIFVIHAVAFSFLAGGVMAIILLITNKNGWKRMKHLSDYLKCCFLTFSFLPYSNIQDTSDGAKFRFSYAIAAGVLITCAVLF